MKKVFLIGGTSGVGKTTTCKELERIAKNAVFLDGDWCWESNPFVVNEETKDMVIDNICYLLNNFIHCSAYENIIFCWEMHRQSIIDTIEKRLDLTNCIVKKISLVCSENALRNRLFNDVAKGIREKDTLERSMERLPLYDKLDTIKIDVSDRMPFYVAEEIAKL